VIGSLTALGNFAINLIKEWKRFVPEKWRRRQNTAELLGRAAVQYAEQLHNEGKLYAVVRFRSNLSMTLHILGLHKARSRLGEIARTSAVALGDLPVQAEILIDDVGWANYLLGKDLLAVQNIRSGINLANGAKKSASTLEAVRLTLCSAKGLRHIAAIRAGDSFDEAMRCLDQAFAELALLEPNVNAVRRDVGQVHYTRGLAIAKHYHVHVSGLIRPGDHECRQAATDALGHVDRAIKIFHEIVDHEAEVKALALKERLLGALGQNRDAGDVRITKENILKNTEWPIAKTKRKTLEGIRK
jgi:hypothetical protein